MAFEPVYKKPGDLIRSEEWNQIQDELLALKKYIQNMTRSTTLTGLESSTGTFSRLFRDAPQNFNYGVDVMGLISGQYYLGGEGKEICTYGINDFADIIYYWSGASKGEADALKITLEYVDGTTFASEKLFINEWYPLKPKSEKNPYVEFIGSSKGVWYKYGLVNPRAEKEIRYITFEETLPESGVRIANVVHYVTRILPLSSFPGMK